MLINAALVVVLVALAVVQARFYARRHRVRRMTWDDHLARLKPVNLRSVEEVAESFLSPSKSQLRLEPIVMWEYVGRREGLNVLNANADVILDLAAFAARWDDVEGRVVAKMIRHDGVRLKRAVRIIKLIMFCGIFRNLAPLKLQEAAAHYHLMRRRLLGLYETANTDLYPRLAEAV